MTLQSLGGNGTTDLASVTTDSAGRFAFAHLADADGAVYAVYTRYQQALFTTGSITVQGGTQNVQLVVYEVTGSDAALRITSITALVRDPRPVNGLIGVGEFFTFHNSGNTAYLGSTQAGAGLPMNLLRFALPTGATNVTLGAGFDGAQSATVSTGFGATATVPPGDSQFAFAFDLPYTGTSALLTIKAEYPTDSALLLVPPPYTAQPQGMLTRGQISSNGVEYSAFTRGALAAGTQVAARLSGLPPAGESPALGFGQLVALAGALALLLAALVAIYIRRGQLPFALGVANAALSHDSVGAQPAQPVEGDVEREQLLYELLALQQARGRGELTTAQFRRRTADVRAALRALIASEMAPATAVSARTAPTITGDGAPEVSGTGGCRRAGEARYPCVPRAGGERGTGIARDDGRQPMSAQLDEQLPVEALAAAEATDGREVVIAQSASSRRVPAIVVERLGKTYEWKPVLRGVSFTLDPGRMLALLGPNGAGKTTLLRILATLSRPTKGSARIDGLDVVRDANAVRARVGYVGHAPLLYEELTAEENLRFFARMYGLRDGSQRAAWLLERVGLRSKAREQVYTLSRGQTQRLALARALLHTPSLLLLDEPDAGLDDAGLRVLSKVIEEWRSAGRTLVMATHAHERALGLADDALALVGGRVAHVGPARDLSPDAVSDLYRQARQFARRARMTTLKPSQLDMSAPVASRLSVSWLQFRAIVAKDVRSELRARHIWLGMGFFALLVLVVFNFAFDLRVDNTLAVAPGALWVAFVFASVIGLGRTVAAEMERGRMDRLLLCPVDRQALFLAKLAGNLLFMGAVELVAIPVFAVLYNVPVLVAGIVPVVLLGTLGIATLGTLLAAVAATTRAREILLPLLAFPLLVPVVIAAVKATQALVSPVANDAPWLGLLVAFDVLMLSVAALTFQYVVED